VTFPLCQLAYPLAVQRDQLLLMRQQSDAPTTDSI
jgi:hypothetical protein